MSDLAIADRISIARRGQRLEYFTIAWNVLEGFVAIAASLAAGSISLLSFGLDSLIEVASGAAVLWRMSVDARSSDRERDERRALKIVGLCFLLLALFVTYESTSHLWFRKTPEHSIPGIILACISLVVMPLLSRAKRKVGSRLQSAAMQAEARQTDFCMYLSAILLTGLVLNAFFGFWWTDPLAALLMVPVIFREGWITYQGRACDCSI